MARGTEELKRDILKALRKRSVPSYFRLATIVGTNFHSVKNNCEALESYGFVKIEKVPKEKSPSKKESFLVSITKEGLRFLGRLTQ